MATPEERELTLAIVRKLHAQVDKYIALPPPVRTNAREIGESLHILFLPVPADEDSRSLGLANSVALTISSPNMNQRAVKLLERESIALRDLPVLLSPIVFLMLEATVTNFSDKKLSFAPKDHTRPNYLVFGDIVLYRLVYAAVAELRGDIQRAATVLSPENFRMRTYDLAAISVTGEGDAGGAGKSLVYCASKKCTAFGVHPYRCSRCKVAYYCTPAHQTDDWKDLHKGECRKHVRLHGDFAAAFAGLATEATAGGA